MHAPHASVPVGGRDEQCSSPSPPPPSRRLDQGLVGDAVHVNCSAGLDSTGLEALMRDYFPSCSRLACLKLGPPADADAGAQGWRACEWAWQLHESCTAAATSASPPLHPPPPPLLSPCCNSRGCPVVPAPLKPVPFPSPPPAATAAQLCLLVRKLPQLQALYAPGLSEEQQLAVVQVGCPGGGGGFVRAGEHRTHRFVRTGGEAFDRGPRHWQGLATEPSPLPCCICRSGRQLPGSCACGRTPLPCASPPGLPTRSLAGGVHGSE
jgi:hypothetical protein